MIKKQYLKSKPVCKVTFTLPKEAATDAKEVRLLGEFNDWNWLAAPAMKSTKTEFKTTIELATGRSYQFRYLIDQDHWENDWNADEYVTSPFTGIENSVVVVDEVLDVAPAKAKKAPAKKAAAKKAPAKKAPAKKATTAKATKKTKDNLKKIEGIGPKIEKLMNEAGIMTFADLAKAKAKVLKDILAAAGPRFKMHDPATWSKQAKLAAADKWEQLTKLQDELKGGKKVKK